MDVIYIVYYFEIMKCFFIFFLQILLRKQDVNYCMLFHISGRFCHKFHSVNSKFNVMKRIVVEL